MASLQFKNKRAYAVEWREGKLKWNPLGKFHRMVDAKIAFETWTAGHAKGIEIGFLDALDKYLAYIKPTKAPTTYKVECDYSVALKKVFAPYRLTEIDRNRLEEWIKSDNVKKSTWAKRLQILKNIFLHSKSNGYLVSDVFESFKIPRVKLSEMEPRAVAIEVLDAVIANLEEKYKPMAMIMRYTGMRPCEVRRLTLDDIIRNPNKLTARGKGKPHDIAVRPELKTYLTPENIPIRFPITTFSHALMRACKKAGYPRAVTPYVFRHTVATYALEKTRDLRAVQTLLGHSRPEMTARYAHSSVKALNDLIEAL